MKKFTKSLLTLVLLVLAVGGVKAQTLPEGLTDLKDLTGTNSNWANTVVYPKEFAVQQPGFGDGDGSSESTHVNIDGYDYIAFKVSAAVDNSVALRVWIWDDVNSKVVTLYPHPIENYETADFAQECRITAPGTYVVKVQGYKYLKGVKAANNWGAPSVTVSRAYVGTGEPVALVAKSIEATDLWNAEVPSSTDLKDLTGTNSSWASSVVYPKEFAVQGAAFGDGDGSSESTHVNINGYDYLAFYVSKAEANSVALRVWIWDDVNSQVVTLYPHPIEDYETADYAQEYRITTPGTYVVKVQGYKYLKGVKAANNWGSPSVTVSTAYAGTGTPVAKVNTQGLLDLKSLTGTDGNWANTVVYPKEFAVQGAAFGNGDGSSESFHVDIDAYDYIAFKVSAASKESVALRVWIWDDVNSKVVTLYPYPIENYETADFAQECRITAPGTYVVKVQGYKYLKGVKAANNWGAPSVTVARAYVGTGAPIVADKYGYSLEGEETGSASLAAALADVYATFYDATGVAGSDIDLTSVANKNALFKANAGVLANTNNVIVDGVCANLVLTDGNYPFKAPADFTATNVSYNREFKEMISSTVCLPFALTEDDLDVINGGFYDLTGVAALGDDFTYSLIEAGTTAYRPYVFEPDGDGVLFEGFTDKLIPATPATLTGATVKGYTMTGVLAGSSDVAADNEGKTVYGWSGNDGKEGELVKVGAGVSIEPFRAYVVYDGGGASPARIAARLVGKSVTGIDEVSETQKAQNSDGKFVENGKIVIVKNGVKYNAAGAQVK